MTRGRAPLSYGTYPGYAEPYALAAYPGYVDFTLAVVPAFVPFTVAAAYPGYTSFSPPSPYVYNTWSPTAYAGYTAFALAAYPTYEAFSFDPVFSHDEYAMIRNHEQAPYYLRMPDETSTWRRYDVKYLRMPNHIDKHDMNHLFYYHKAWYYQEYDTCKATCTGSMSPKTAGEREVHSPPPPSPPQFEPSPRLMFHPARYVTPDARPHKFRACTHSISAEPYVVERMKERDWTNP